ncbi:MAG: carboxypeptidase-like regulatory domain-containing protein, partial [Ginsengibacter sp.]
MFKSLLLPLLLISTCGMGQIKISGRVTINKKNPLAGVSVSIKDSYDGATTDSLGNYSFTATEK